MRKVIKVLDGVTATTTASPVSILGASKVTLVVERAAHASGSSLFAATVGVETSYATYSKWIKNIANTNGEMLTRVASLSLAGNGVDFLTMSPEDSFEFIIVKVTETTDGTHSAWLVIDTDEQVK